MGFPRRRTRGAKASRTTLTSERVLLLLLAENRTTRRSVKPYRPFSSFRLHPSCPGRAPRRIWRPRRSGCTMNRTPF
ncbi:hypothetical protein B005_2828 [Nocardiopsis alba ATCC BAA-2165]|uniref:Uncharacterized protein n=1 Tax=Nocardiopsis alba (strain ATCC BAA-2165 / BE74) TaxID=1205910 RepID=J7L0N8_NOCAA|nr:hypothetical protein B005_2828 [Nocardiopsis alba ATCC BAA-2165]